MYGVAQRMGPFAVTTACLVDTNVLIDFLGQCPDAGFNKWVGEAQDA